MKNDRLYVIHVVECINRILEFTIEGKTFFLSDLKTQDAVLRNLHILSESIQKISSETKLKYPATPCPVFVVHCSECLTSPGFTY